ncbi:helix-turn-helix domain-containing protein [Botrimarina hoheduenensis]|uniref:Bacterial regulatory protein, luxR family n=1 Tax=Botrimarina hoheduenensis TaxID=2528000 RepID=A0A5C5VXS3_9BACT|nr:helix-turn-helix transcriptional regulator [Botrimarina hoheduenensis]TWT42937.1 Bacterial regulatory protein, luxR family [Botrimarina hoheduenensis]
MPLDSSSQASLAESYVLIVSADGTCVLHPRVPEYVGQKPWEWCTSEDSEACREAFVQACMFRKESQFITHMRYDGRIFKLSMHLYPLGEGGQVLCSYHRVFEGELTRRERHVLALIAGGADAKQTADALGISPSTVRDYIAGIKRKLHVVTQEGFTLAAHHFGLSRTPEEV